MPVSYTHLYNRKMKRAFKRNREKIADINSQIEDSLSGIRVVKSFANEEIAVSYTHLDVYKRQMRHILRWMPHLKM